MYMLLLCAKNCIILQWIITSLVVLLSTLRWLFWDNIQLPLDPDIDNLSITCNIRRCERLRSENHYLLEDSFEKRVQYYVNDDNGYLNKPCKEQSFGESMESSNTLASSIALKATLTYNLLQCILGYSFSHLFRSQILAVLPFLTIPYNFRWVIQFGLYELRVSNYMSAVPFFMLILFNSSAYIEIYKYFTRKPVNLANLVNYCDFRNDIDCDVQNDTISFQYVFDSLVTSMSKKLQYEKDVLSNVKYNTILNNVEVMLLSQFPETTE